MELCDDKVSPIKCHKFQQRLYGTLNVIYNTSNSMIAFWNKYQIFIYENRDFNEEDKVFIPEFQIAQIILTNNYLVCRDINNNIHITPLKFKNAAQKRFKSSFQPRQQGVVICVQYNEEYIVSLQFESGTYFVCIHKINVEFQLVRKFTLNCDSEIPNVMNDKHLLSNHIVPTECLKNMFGIKEPVRSDCTLLLISFDNVTVYGCLLDTKASEDILVLLQLYSCPTEICSVTIVNEEESNILISLKIGTLVKLPLHPAYKQVDIIHLNTALNKSIVVNSSMVYSDGKEFWKIENIFATDLKFIKIFVRDAKDFVIIGDEVICTTFTNLVYIFSLEEKRVYLETKTTESYCTAENLFNNSEYLIRTMEEVDKNCVLIKQLNREANFLTALSLANRPDILENIIQVKVVVFESYEDVLKENLELTLTNDMHEYFANETFLILIKITSVAEQLFYNMMAEILDNLRLHISISTGNKLIKTTSIKLKEVLKKLNIVMPLRVQNVDITDIKIDLKMISKIIGSMNERETVWIMLYSKTITLHSEHFVKSCLVPTKNSCLKELEATVHDLVHESVCQHFGNAFNIVDFTKIRGNTFEWPMYLKLPSNYEDLLENPSYFKEHLNYLKAHYFLQQFSSSEFLKSKSNICLEVGNTKIKFKIINDELCGISMKIWSENIQMAYNLRMFLSKLMYSGYKNMNEDRKYVENALYTVTENLGKELKTFEDSASFNNFMELFEHYQSNVIGCLPL